MTISLNVLAKETVQVIFPFIVNPNFGYKIIEEANKLQDDWNFIVVPKPGAGGEIAANTVLSGNKLSILSGTSSFFIRPTLYLNNSYHVDQFRLLITQCELPMVVVSKKYKSLNDIARDQRITIGVTGLGATTHVVALELSKLYPNIVIVPYNGISETLKAVLGGDVDLSIGFAKQWQGNIEAKTITVLKFEDGDKIFNNFFLAVNKNIPIELYDKWKKLFDMVNESLSVRNSYKDEFCTPMVGDNEWFNQQEKLWKTLTKDIKVQ
jgi:hypothetical protein